MTDHDGGLSSNQIQGNGLGDPRRNTRCPTCVTLAAQRQRARARRDSVAYQEADTALAAHRRERHTPTQRRGGGA